MKRILWPAVIVAALIAGGCETVKRLTPADVTDFAAKVEKTGAAIPGPAGDAVELLGWAVGLGGGLWAAVERRRKKRAAGVAQNYRAGLDSVAAGVDYLLAQLPADQRAVAKDQVKYLQENAGTRPVVRAVLNERGEVGKA